MPLRILTRYINPPIPQRSFDWVAYVEGEEEGMGYGYGRTETEAVADLVNHVLQGEQHP